MAKCEFSNMTPEERRENGRKGGIASGEAKRKKKAIRETLEVFLDMKMKSGRHADIEEIQSFAALKGKNISVQEAMVISILQRAMKGDVKAAEWIRDTAGQNPSQKIDVNGAVPVMFVGDDELDD